MKPVKHQSRLIKNLSRIIERAYNNPEWYIDMLRNIDFILFEWIN